MAGVVRLWFEHGTPVEGLWCRGCLLSTGVRVDLVRLDLSGVTRVHSSAACLECGGRDIDLEL